MTQGFIIPVGTQVVTRIEVQSGSGEMLHPIGAVGIVVKAPTDTTHSYRVRFLDGVEASFRGDQLTIRKHYQRSVAIGERESNLFDHVIFRCIVGSQAYGLEEAASDTDRRGIYLPPADYILLHDNHELIWRRAIVDRVLVIESLGPQRSSPKVRELLRVPLAGKFPARVA